jgi:carbonic anhydrase/acetyltransferase-like protein (isoleucine patch superfamily)
MPIYALHDHSPRLPEEGRYWIAPSAEVIGNVRLGLDVGIWFCAVLRGDNEPIEVGDRTNVQEGAMLHTDPGFPLRIGADCTIGHQAIVHGCTIGTNSLVGMGATVLNGARIGNNCLIGAKALVTEGKEFPDNSLIVGAPAKVARALDANTFESLRRSALNYVSNWQRYATGAKKAKSWGMRGRPPDLLPAAVTNTVTTCRR